MEAGTAAFLCFWKWFKAGAGFFQSILQINSKDELLDWIILSVKV